MVLLIHNPDELNKCFSYRIDSSKIETSFYSRSRRFCCSGSWASCRATKRTN